MEPAVTLFVPCYVDALRGRAGRAAVEVLECLGYSVAVRPDAICCGQPFTTTGCAEEGDAATRLWYRRMAGAGSVVVLSSSCTVHLRHHGVGTGGADSTDSTEAPRVYEFCEFLTQPHPRPVQASLERAVCLHSSCHGLRDSDADRQARALLATVKGLEVRTAERADECCGFGGHFAVDFPGLSVRMGDDRLREIRATGVTEVVATDLSCLLHLEGIDRADGKGVLRFRHIAELYREALP